MKKNGGNQMDTLKILVVDDESRMRKLVKDFLTKKNSRYWKPVMVKKPWISFMRRRTSH